MRTPKEIVNGVIMEFMLNAVTAQETHNFDANEKFVSCNTLKQIARTICDVIDNDEREQEFKKREEERIERINQPIKKILFIEEGSVEVQNLINEFNERNSEIKIIVYKKGSKRPEILDIEESNDRERKVDTTN